MSAVIDLTDVFRGDLCARCGAHMQATHHPLCQRRDGTPTILNDREVRRRLGPKTFWPCIPAASNRDEAKLRYGGAEQHTEDE